MEVVVESDWNPWIGSLIGAVLVGLSGVIPLIIIPDSTKLKDNSSSSSNSHTPLGNKNPLFFHTIYFYRNRRLVPGPALD